MASPVRFSEVRKKLEAAGYRLVRISSSHHIFEKPGQPIVSIPVHGGKVKPVYVRKIDNLIAAAEERGAEDAGGQREEEQAGEDQ
jgi:predicted RNA binding protein YcfA (HicA-like mRNA interferase family)